MAFLRKRFTLTELRDQELTALLNNICSPPLMITSGWILDAIALVLGRVSPCVLPINRYR